MSLFFIVGVMAYFIFSIYEEATGKKYSDSDENRLMIMTVFVILAVLAVLLSLICICGKVWDCVPICSVLALLFSAIAFITYYKPKK